MLKFFIISVLCFNFLTTGVFASELLGRISTNPNNIDTDQTKENKNNGQEVKQPQSSSNNSFIFLANKAIENPSANNGGGLVVTVPEQANDENVVVLGVENIAEGTLVRGKNKQIYIIVNNSRKYIPSLADLKKYAGQKIYDLSEEEINNIPPWKHPEGDLLRKMGTEAVYVLEHGLLRHILNLEELSLKHSGKVIYNVSESEMKHYVNRKIK